MSVIELEEVREIEDPVERLTSSDGLGDEVDKKLRVVDPAGDAIRRLDIEKLVVEAPLAVVESSGCGKARANSTPDPSTVLIPDTLAK